MDSLRLGQAQGPAVQPALMPRHGEGLDGRVLQHPFTQRLSSPGRPFEVPHDAPHFELCPEYGFFEVLTPLRASRLLIPPIRRWEVRPVSVEVFEGGLSPQSQLERDESPCALDSVARSGGCLLGRPGAGGRFTPRFARPWSNGGWSEVSPRLDGIRHWPQPGAPLSAPARPHPPARRWPQRCGAAARLRTGGPAGSVAVAGGLPQ